MVLSKHLLGPLVRETCIVVSKLCKVDTEGLTHPYATRARFIDDIINKYRKQTDLTEFYMTTFCPLPNSAVVPSMFP